ncbi:hypothetical protein TTMY_0819 [Thermus thermophilus]|nr:hypothetical protein TTMY_0819 [Thermus thermophilus]BDB11884.1 hypothetical protein TthTMY_16230 [Thermus thermophilus]
MELLGEEGRRLLRLGLLPGLLGGGLAVAFRLLLLVPPLALPLAGGGAFHTTPCWLAPAWGPRQKVPKELPWASRAKETGRKGISAWL